MRAKEEGVGTPRVRFAPSIYEVISGGFGKLAAVFFLDVLYVCGVFRFSVVHPCDTNSN